MANGNGYPDDWHARRRQIYERDDWACQNCGRRGGPYGDQELHAHHIVPKGRGGSHRISNLVTLCDDCHAAVHNRYKTAPTAGQQDTGTSWAVRIRQWWQVYKRIRRLF